MKQNFFLLAIISSFAPFVISSCITQNNVEGTTETYFYEELPESNTSCLNIEEKIISAYLRTWPMDIDKSCSYWKADSIKGDKLTEVNISFAKIKDDYTIYIPDTEENSYWYEFSPLNLKSELKSLHEKYPELLLTLSIGGGGDGSEGFSQMANNSTNRKVFVESVVSFIKEYNFTGIDIDWECPVGPVRGSKHYLLPRRQNCIHLTACRFKKRSL